MMKTVDISNDNNNLHDKNEKLNDKSKTTSRTAYRRVVMDPKRHRFHNKAAVYLTVASLVMVAVLCVVYGETHNPSSSPSSSFATDGDTTRWLEENSTDDDDDTVRDFSDYSCRYLYSQAPRPGEKQCAFARSCNGGDGVWAAWIFCRNTESFTTIRLFWIMMPIMIIWMVTLFRLLGSTSEDYFSPSLEMFSTKLGLPPRFAGVSLLALGNGAADVSATVSAMVNDELNGYKLSLGALSGAAMLIGGVVAGIVVLVAEGVPCRGALVRDVSALFVTILLVWQQLAMGEVGPHTVTLFLSMYGLFVFLVLAADIYHRRVVIPRLQAAADHLETLRQMEDARIVQEGAAAQDGGMTGLPSNLLETPPRSTLSRMITSISNYDNPASSPLCGSTTLNGEDGTTPIGWGVDSSELEQDRPIILHGQHGILHGDGTAEASGPDVVATEPTSPARDGAGSYTLVHDELMDRVCVDGSSPASFAASSWKGAVIDGKQDIIRHFTEVWEDIAWNGDLHVVEKFLLLCEFPFTVLRKLTVPVPVEGYYNRGIIAISFALSPLWFAFYLWYGKDINLFHGEACVLFLLSWAVTILLSVLVLRFAPGGEGNMNLVVAAPLALYGFAIAATWIDFIADRLVSLLDFMGIVLHIPSSIMGLTVLAWGNSMGDLSANITMARKGLANMAMTACFAGPVFNILIGLGLGFSSLASETGNAKFSVSLTPSVVTGFVFVLLNCASILITGFCLGKGRIEIYYGYIALALYTVYLIISISLQLTD